MKSADLHGVSVPSHNGCSWSKWTEGLSCVLNSLLLSLGPIVVSHQTASLFSSREEVQVCDELELQSDYQVQMNSALCAGAVQAKTRRRLKGISLRIGFCDPRLLSSRFHYLHRARKKIRWNHDLLSLSSRITVMKDASISNGTSEHPARHAH